MFFIMLPIESAFSPEPANYSVSRRFFYHCSIFQIDPWSLLNWEQAPVSEVLCVSETNLDTALYNPCRRVFWFAYCINWQLLIWSSSRLMTFNRRMRHYVFSLCLQINNIYSWETAIVKLCQPAKQRHHLIANSSTNRNKITVIICR